MKEYHKIHTVFKRDSETKFKSLLIGEWSLPEFNYLQNNRWMFTEKVDGMNIRVQWFYENREIKFAGKTDRAQIPTFLHETLLSMFTRHQMEQVFAETDACLYGEGYGAKIQKGGNYLRDSVSFVLFDVRIGNWWLKRNDVQNIADSLGIKRVPVVGAGTLHDMVELVKGGFNSRWGNFQAEGVVAVPAVELKTRSGQRVITKLKCKDFVGITRGDP